MFVARIEIRLHNDYGKYPRNEWVELFTLEDVRCKWKYNKNRSLEFILGVFDTETNALKEGKKLYTLILYRFLWSFHNIETGCAETIYDTGHFSWTKKHSGFFPGLATYEVDSSIDDFESIYGNHLTGIVQSSSPNTEFPFKDLDKYRNIGIDFSKETQTIFSLIEIACNSDEPVNILVLCSALEMFSINENQKKSIEEISLIDTLISCVDSSNLEDKQKHNLKTYLSNGKEIGSRNKCLNTIKKYCKRDIAGLSPEEIFSKAYSIRNKIIHGGKIYGHEFEPVQYFKYVVLEAFWGVMKEKRDYEAGLNM